MTAMNNDTIDVINKLIETCRDGQEGYRDAAEHAEDSDLKDIFRHQSLERAKFAGELESVARHLGEDDPPRSPSIANKFHRVWFELKQKMGGGDRSILESVEAGEDTAKKHYEEALQANLPNDVYAIVEAQASCVLAAHDQIRSLRDQYRKAA
jgi:uncharacterized protein (TIGR02284 family)